MKPILLDLEAFGPYGDPVSIDFEPLADIGLFVISGPTGAGKSTIFDAMCFALYGSLSGVRSGHNDVRSHHADPAAVCTVTLVFDAGDERWRVHRKPQQTVLKKRGTGTTNKPAEAHLERWNGGDWEPIVTGVRDVTARCRDLVGLTLDQFERVVMLPQGKFAEVLNASTSERSDLLRTLFGSEIYDRAADLLLDQVREAERSLGGVQDQRAIFQQRVLDAIGRVEEALDDLPADVAEQLAAAALTSQPDPATAETAQLSLLDPIPFPEESGTARDDLDIELDAAARLAALADGPVTHLRRIGDGRRQTAELAGLALERAKMQIDTIEKRAEARRLIEILEGQTDDMLGRRQRAATARRVAALPAAIDARSDADLAVRLVSEKLAGSWGTARSIAADIWERDLPIELATTDTHAELVRSLIADAVALATQLDRVVELEDQRRSAEREIADLRSRVDQLDAAAAKATADTEARAAERAGLDTEATNLTTRMHAAPELSQQVETLEAHVEQRTVLDAANAELERIDTQRTSITAAIDAADTEIQRLDAEIADATTASAELGAAKAALALAERRCQARTELQAANGELARAATSAERAQTESDRIFASFVDRTAPRLASQLVDGEPCSVCGSREHPAPAVAESGDAAPIDADAVETAASAAAAAKATESEWRARIASLIEADPEAAGVSDEDLAAARTAAQAAADAASAAVDQLAGLRSARDTLDSGRTDAVACLTELDEQRALTLATAHAAAGALGPAADQPAQQLTEQLATAREQLAGAEAARHRLEALDVRRRQLTDADTAASEAARRHASDRATAIERIGSLEQRVAACIEKISAVLADRSLVELRHSVTELRALLDRWQHDVLELTQASATLAAARARCEAVIADADFADEAEAVAATLDPAVIEQLEAAVGRWENELTVHRATLTATDDHDLPADPPDLDQLSTAAVEAGAAHRLVDDVLTRIDHDQAAAAADLADVEALDAAHAQQLADVEVLQRVAHVVRGQNSRRLSLENWVLSVYLHDVVAHANRHLSTMSNGRYRLVVDDTPANQQGQHGLDLSVDDAHTGRVRASASLSGGETFQASLALALGLADVVMLGRAGLRLDALFIDEGFGSLDAESIDQAITVLDGLRSRGSMVGVITHVEAMKAALPVAIDVQRRADLNGSKIRQVA